MSETFTLYGSPASLYTGKVRAYLNYKNIPYKEEISSLKVYKKIILPHTGVGMIPVVATPQGEYWQDSSLIIDQFESLFKSKPVYPSSPKQKLIALLFEVYGDEWLRLPAMHYRWNFPADNLEFIKQEFGSSVAPSMPKFIQRWLGKKVVDKFSGLVVPLGITSKSIAAIEAWYEDFLLQLNVHFGEHDFLLGSCPSIGDYGLMGPLYAHLYRDPYPGKLMQSLGPNVVAWVERMNQSQDIDGEFLADDIIPTTLEPILSRLFGECWPALESASQAITEWAEGRAPGTTVPRRLGMQSFTIGDTTEQQMSLSFSQWMMQRPLDFYQSLPEPQKEAVDSYLTPLGGKQAINFKPTRRVELENYKLVLEA